MPAKQPSRIYEATPAPVLYGLQGQSSAVHVGFNRPAFVGGEAEEVTKAILEKQQLSGDGYYTKLCEKWLSDTYQAPTLLTSSCTHALEMAALLLNLQAGDEVILPSFTFVSTANAFVLRGATIQFADCDEFGQLSLDSVKKCLTPNTKAICVVHYAGHSTDMEALSAFCKEHGLFLVEDAAQAIGARYQDRLLGTWGDLACLSFHETKNVSSGEGGALIINNPAFAERAHFLREKGTNRSKFVQGLVDKYTWVDLGSSYVMSDMNAAHLWVHLQNLETINQKRLSIWTGYQEALAATLPKGIQLLQVPSKVSSNAHLFALIFEQPEYRTAFIHFMRQAKITAPFHYVALHSSPYAQQLQAEGKAFADEAFEQTNRLAQGLVRLPLFYNMSDEQHDWVITAVERFFRHLKATQKG